MNTNILIYILISVFALALIILPFYLKRKGIVKETDIAKMLPQIIVGSGLFFELVNSLDLTQEPQIKKIAKIVDETLKYVEEIINNNITDEQVLDYVDAMCTQFNVELDDTKLNIVKKLLEVGINEIKSKCTTTDITIEEKSVITTPVTSEVNSNAIIVESVDKTYFLSTD